MSTSAAHIATAAQPSVPVELDEQVRQISARVDWEAALPQHAYTLGWRAQYVLKRLLDIVLSATALIVLSPLLVVVALLVKFTSPGPIFYEWRVLGYRGRAFVGYKFRSMVVDADALKLQYLGRNEMMGPVFKLRDDPRITGFGRWMRKYSVDELPQLWSVLKGDMSLVGPRPPSAGEFVQFEKWQHAKLSVTPGITCLWQVSGRSEISDFADWAKLDLEYIRTWNLWLDIRILLRTIPTVLSARGAY
jgi:lipopolysaccharide/colanic/teichoic acid biosynthesis glycosyltransferase